MRSLTLVTVCTSSALFLITIGFTANSIKQTSRLLHNVDLLDGHDQDPLSISLSAASTATLQSGVRGSSSSSLDVSSILASLSSALSVATATPTATNSANAAAFSALAQSYSSFFGSFNGSRNGPPFFGGGGGGGGLPPRALPTAGSILVEQQQQYINPPPRVTIAPLLVRSAAATTDSAKRDASSAILAMFVLMLVDLLGLLVAGLVLIATSRRHYDTTIHLASQRRPSRFLVIFAALTALLLIFGVVAFALLGVFFEIKGSSLTATHIAFWALSVAAAMFVCCAVVLLEKPISQQDGGNGVPVSPDGTEGSHEIKQSQNYSQHTSHTPSSPPLPPLTYYAQQDIQPPTTYAEGEAPYEVHSPPQPTQSSAEYLQYARQKHLQQHSRPSSSIRSMASE